MKGTFSENRPYLEHEYEHPHWNAESGLCAPALRQALRGFIEENLALPMPLLRANALDFLLANAQIELNPHTPFADKLNLGIDYSDYAGQDLFAEEMYHRFHREVLMREMPEDFARRNQAERLGVCTADTDFWHTLPEWPNLLRLGFGGLLRRAEDAMAQKRAEGTLAAEAEIFYQSVILSYRAILNYIRRLREASARMEMPEYTACLDALLQGPPQTLYQALEACMIFMNVEEIGVERARSFGRADQLWYPFYRSDLDTGRATEEEIKELLRYFYIKLQAGRRYADQPFSICGVDENGEDATNGLSWLLLDVYDGMNIHNPKIHVCCSEKTPKALLLRVLDMIRRGNSSFVFINDEVVWRGYERIGIPLAEARGYVPFGCYEPILMGREEPMIGASWLNMAKAAELVMHGGRDTLTGERMFSQTPEDFSDFASFKAAFYTLLGDIIDFTMDNILKQDRFHMQINPSPVYSGSLTSCIEKGRDIFDGGTKYHNTSIKCCGIATAADCLLAVKTLVFERGLVRFPELSAILQANWEGHETLRRIAEKLLGKFCGPVDRVVKMQYVQYEWVRVTMELFRRNKGFSWGLLYWMLSDCWPGCGWSLIDYYALPKLAYYAFRRAAKGQIAAIEKKDGTYRVFVCNDTLQTAEGSATLRLLTPERTLRRWDFRYTCAPNASNCVFSVPAAEAEPQLLENALLVCDIEGDRAFFTERSPAFLRLPEPELTVCRAGEACLRITAKSFLYAVILDGEYLFSDNGFLLLPGEAREVSFAPAPGARSKRLELYLPGCERVRTIFTETGEAADALPEERPV